MTSILVLPAAAAQTFGRAILTIAIAGVLAWVAPGARAADADIRAFGIPRGDATVTLKQFTAQAGVQLLYAMDAVRGD